MKNAIFLLCALGAVAGAQPKKVDPPKKVDAPKKADPKPSDPYADPGPKDPYGPGAPPLPPPGDAPPTVVPRVGLSDLAAVQGLLAVQHLDGWLLWDRDNANPIAVKLVAPEGRPVRPWFYLIPATGQPITLAHTSEVRSFDALPGKKLTYTGYRDFDKQFKAMLKMTPPLKTVAIEYSPKAAVPAVSRVDAGTLEVIKAGGVAVKSSDTLVQYTKAIWGDAGRTAHYVAVHHLVELRKDALSFLTKQLQSGAPVTEYDVQQRLVHGMQIRGLVGSAPVVAAGANTADPYYVPTAAKAAAIKRGDLVVIEVAAKIDKPDGVFAAMTWCAVADTKASDVQAHAFEAVVQARDAALALIGDRIRKHRPVTGAEIDQSTRALFKKAGLVDHVMHRTGHSLDSDLQGGGADLDDFEVKDARILIPGTGFTIGPGLYWPGQFGVQTEVSVYLAPNGPELTMPAQDVLEPLLR